MRESRACIDLSCDLRQHDLNVDDELNADLFDCRCGDFVCRNKFPFLRCMSSRCCVRNQSLIFIQIAEIEFEEHNMK